MFFTCVYPTVAEYYKSNTNDENTGIIKFAHYTGAYLT